MTNTRQPDDSATNFDGFARAAADAREDAIWSAVRDTGTGYGIAVFDYDPADHHGDSSITISYYHAPGADKTPNPNYELFETVVLKKSRAACRNRAHGHGA